MPAQNNNNDPFVVFGVTISQDSSACVLKDGALAGYFREDRLSGNKREASAVRSQLAILRLMLQQQVDADTSGSNEQKEELLNKMRGLLQDDFESSVTRDLRDFDALLQAVDRNSGPFDAAALSAHTMGPRGIAAFKRWFEHASGLPAEQVIDFSGEYHACLAAPAFVNSGFDKALVFVIDREGSPVYSPSVLESDNFNADSWLAKESESVYVATRPLDLKPIYKNYWLRQSTFHALNEARVIEAGKALEETYPEAEVSFSRIFNIAQVYESAVTTIGSFPTDYENSIDLASLGNNSDYPCLFQGWLAENQYFLRPPGGGVVSPVNVGIRPVKTLYEDNFQPYANWARHVQSQTQEAAVKLIKHHVEKTGIKNVVITGCYAANAASTYHYLENFPELDIYVEANCGPSSISIGSALLLHTSLKPDAPASIPRAPYYHSSHEPKDEDYGIPASPRKVAELLAQKKLIAVFEGAVEPGDWSLGHRSVLADPRDADVADKINKNLEREWYRVPRAMFLADHLGEYMNNVSVSIPGRLAVKVPMNDRCSAEMPGIVARDGTCILQTCKEESVGEVLTHFHQMTGCAALAHTDMQRENKSLPLNRRDALLFLRNTGVDGVYFADVNKLVLKK